MKSSRKERLRELAQFLLNRRSRILPEEYGIQSGGRRRTPGLRRSEVATFAGVSVDWYTRLEQGKDIQVSTQVLESLSKVLLLNSNERRHLFLLAHAQEPPETCEYQEPKISSSLQNFLDSLDTTPGCVMDARFNIIAWNQACNLVFGDYEIMSEQERNSVWRAFTSDSFKHLLGSQWEDHARMRLAQFRAEYGRYVGHAWWEEQIQKLKKASKIFKNWWEIHDVQDTPDKEKVIYHPVVGELVFENISFYSSEDPNLQIIISIPKESNDTKDKIKQMFYDLIVLK
ncbi:helix-turn-helix transcriptional regulator [Gottfriedia solisilvae]|uniref:Transcriptional regulator n=1 Tax=Gottfriedia solisilvae TaxID=1516104 RepID=A0A8J3AW97_9BACI|nr:helix-turn-helix transcriptional regulator [Gottfriedia solisilvae]GGI18017.1 transcriptional regulator [Gottfriedia solisilvae]